MNAVSNTNSIASEATLPISDICDVSVVLVNYNTEHLLERVFAALFAARQSLTMQTIVIDNASRDNSVTLLRSRYPDVELIANASNVGFGRANNQALPRIRGRYVLLLNTDAFVAEDTLTKTFAYMDGHPRCGVLGVRLAGESGTLQPSCRYFPTPLNVFVAENGLGRLFPTVQMIDDMSWDHAGTRACDWVPGCFYLIRKSAIDQVGLFDPRFFVYYEEVDHCRRIRQAGWQVTYFGDATVVHIGGESAKADDRLTAAGRQIARLQVESEMLYFRKHHGLTGLLASLALTCCGAGLDLLKDLVRPRKDRPRHAQLQKLKLAFSLLGPTGWATRPTRQARRDDPCMFDNIRHDLQAYDHDWGAQGFWAMLVYRFGRWRYRVRPALLRKFFSALYKMCFKLIQIITGIELPCEAEIGRNFVIDHFGGIIVSGYTRIGDNCRIRNGVTIGLRRVEEKVAPVIGDNVDIGAGAKLLGPIRIGNNVVIGANAVVITDVPDDSIAVGVPAIIKPRRTQSTADD